jgi:hypothetical protein
MNQLNSENGNETCIKIAKKFELFLCDNFRSQNGNVHSKICHRNSTKLDLLKVGKKIGKPHLETLSLYHIGKSTLSK